MGSDSSPSLINDDAGSGTAQAAAGQTVSTFLGSLGAAAATFGAQIILFYLLRNKFTRIYRPKTYLVPEKDRTTPPPGGFWRWVVPIFRTPNAELISKCGLDAYFFLRYLQMLVKIFLPAAILIMPILLPINRANSNPGGNVKGLDTLGWAGVDPRHTGRYWAHLLLACGLIFWVIYVVIGELRGYIRVRQAFMTSPQHRLRASATTVLVTSIPRKWLTYEALDGLYDVFPGGIRNIWINRNFDELSEKVTLRNKLGFMLEGAETALIRKAKKKQMEAKKKEEKAAGKNRSKEDKAKMKATKDQEAIQLAEEGGISSGDPHQAHTLDQTLGNDSTSDTSSEREVARSTGFLGAGLGTIGHGLQGITKLGKNIVGGVVDVPRAVNDRLDAVNDGFIVDGAAEQASLQNHQTMRSPTLREPSETDVAPSSTATGSRDTRPRFDLVIDGSADTSAAQQAQASPLDQQTTRSPTLHGSLETDVARPSTASATRATRLGSAPETWTQNLQAAPRSRWKFWRTQNGIQLPTPEPHHAEGDEFPLTELSHATSAKAKQNAVSKDDEVSKSRIFGLLSRKPKLEDEKEEYASAVNEDFADDKGMEADPEWKKYLTDKDRDTKRLPIYGWTWMPFFPSWTGIGKKVDVIYYCRKELARLNLEIEKDQQEPDKYPLMNSAFIQFNHQVAAHMACQSLSHHVPAQMAPRIVEIAPDDVIWDNLSIKWWERLLRMGLVFVFVTGLIIAWALPVSFTTAISNLTFLSEEYKAFEWLQRVPQWIISAVSGVLPFALLGLLLALLPVILRLAARLQGVQTGMAVELSVQGYYFGFLFVQVFLVVTISTSLIKLIPQLANSPLSAPMTLARNIPKAGNYFFSWMLLQAMSVSAGQLAQIATLALWFLWRPIADNTARQKFNRQLRLPYIRWGTFFPVYTNLACIGLIYSVISPLILIFNIITFGLFWVVYRYQTLYVNQSRFDTGGLLFPRAVNQLFTGLYVMEIALIGLFLLVRDFQDNATCIPQAILMIIMVLVTGICQVGISYFFSPLYRYIPITLEDDAVARDEEFARARDAKWQLVSDEEEGEDIDAALRRREREEQSRERLAEESEAQAIQERRKSGNLTTLSRMGTLLNKPLDATRTRLSWADRSRNSRAHEVEETGASQRISPHRNRHHHHHKAAAIEKDLEAGGSNGAGRAVGDALFGAFSDEIEDLTPEERDRLIQRAFLHKALQARRPVIWIPRDDLGVSDDEVRRTQRFSDKIWISNEFTGLDAKGRVVFRRAPPDFSEVDLIRL